MHHYSPGRAQWIFLYFFEKNKYKDEGDRFGAFSWNYGAPNTPSGWNEQSTGIDLNGGNGQPTSTEDEADLGFYMDVDDGGLINNYFGPVWFPKTSIQDQFEEMPLGYVDGMSIMTHELYHSMGVSALNGMFSVNGLLLGDYSVNKVAGLFDGSKNLGTFIGVKAKQAYGLGLPLDNIVLDDLR